MISEADRIIVRWQEAYRSDTCVWFVRGLNRAGAIYGEVRLLTNRLAGSFDDVVTCESCDRAFELIDVLRRTGDMLPLQLPVSDIIGLVAVGLPSSPTVIYRRESELSSHFSADEAFDNLIGIIRPIVHKACGGLFPA